MSTISNNDLFNNPMVESAKKALSVEQMEEYKKIGEYMYNNNIYNQNNIIVNNEENILAYAVESLRSGLKPSDLSQAEKQCLVSTYGDNWYEKFDFTKDEIINDIFNIDKAVSRQQRRYLERKMKKLNNKKTKN
jgi:hypothetical protein